MLSVIESKKVLTNPNLIILQSKLFSPSFSGPGKWVIYNPDNRKAFLAAGKDTLPDVIPILVDASKNPMMQTEITNSKFERMYKAGLLISSCLKENSPQTLISNYHKAVFNYPFRDYYDNQWANKDIETMNFYSKLWDHPPMITYREGETTYLPKVYKNNLHNDEKALTLTFISALLKYVFSPFEDINSYPVSGVRKISPSGGAKHPTEVVVYLPKDYEHVNKGLYVYDVANHSLIEEKGYILENFKNINDNTIGLLIRNRVERPMWRYREIRSYRAVMIDTGHVIENIKQLCGYNDFYTKHVTPPQKELSDFSWIKEPEISFLLIGTKEDVQKSQVLNQSYLNLTQHKRSITNPALYFTFDNGRLICNTLWPKINRFSISYKEFEILTHCLPSRRGDRDVTDKGITSKFHTDHHSITTLKSRYALLPETTGKNFYKELNLWVKHNWYLNFLVNCEGKLSCSPNEDMPSIETPLFENSNILFKRKTTRKFSDKEIAEKQFKKIIHSIIPEHEKDENTRIVVNVKNVQDVPSGLYSFNILKNKLEFIKEKLNHEQVRDLVIGQKWAGSGSLDIWIYKKLDLFKPGTYESDIVKLGEAGQRICIVCTQENLGVFMTPAVKDEQTFDILELEDKYESLVYHFTIGHKED